jgi:hypothetical protein
MAITNYTYSNIQAHNIAVFDWSQIAPHRSYWNIAGESHLDDGYRLLSLDLWIAPSLFTPRRH